MILPTRGYNIHIHISVYASVNMYTHVCIHITHKYTWKEETNCVSVPQVCCYVAILFHFNYYICTLFSQRYQQSWENITLNKFTHFLLFLFVVPVSHCLSSFTFLFLAFCIILHNPYMKWMAFQSYKNEICYIYHLLSFDYMYNI